MNFDAMVLAAGYGRRLRPLTEETPKALVQVGELTQLERTIGALERAGADRVVVNTHHHAGQIEAVLHAREGASRVVVSREDPQPLETGGGLLHARAQFRGDRPIVVHNVDVITSIDLRWLLERHATSGGLATLAVQERAASRYLLFDEAGLQGRLDVRSGFREEVREQHGALRRLAFTGVHVVDPRVFGLTSETGSFSIIDLYLRLAGDGEVVVAEDVGDAEWFEIGTPERLATARAHFRDEGMR